MVAWRMLGCVVSCTCARLGTAPRIVEACLHLVKRGQPTAPMACCLALQVPLWSRIGRLKRSTFPKLTGGGNVFGGGASAGALQVRFSKLEHAVAWDAAWLSGQGGRVEDRLKLALQCVAHPAHCVLCTRIISKHAHHLVVNTSGAGGPPAVRHLPGRWDSPPGRMDLHVHAAWELRCIILMCAPMPAGVAHACTAHVCTAARELLREVDYTLKTLAASQLGETRGELAPAEVPRRYESSEVRQMFDQACSMSH